MIQIVQDGLCSLAGICFNYLKVFVPRELCCSVFLNNRNFSGIFVCVCTDYFTKTLSLALFLSLSLSLSVSLSLSLSLSHTHTYHMHALFSPRITCSGRVWLSLYELIVHKLSVHSACGVVCDNQTPHIFTEHNQLKLHKELSSAA